MAHHANALLIISAEMLLDVAFLALWVAVAWATDHWIIEPLKLKGVDATILEIFRWLFAGTTLVPIAWLSLTNIVTLLVRGWRSLWEDVSG